jgi:hypothetical protein
MAGKTNVLLEVASLSLRVSRRFVADYSHPKSPKKFTQPQLLACLVLRAYLKATYRGVVEVLEASDALRTRLGLGRLPHFSTLKRFADRSDVPAVIDRMLAEVVREFAPEPELAAIDATGIETTSASAHYLTRSGKTRKKYVKVSVCVAVGSLLPAALVVSWGPYNDKREARPLLEKARQAMRPGGMLADAGYDAEWVHEDCRDDLGVASLIKPVVHRADRGVRGAHRSKMTEDFLAANGYGRRWAVESFMSGLKRTTGAALAARSERSLFVEAALRVLAYALRR